MEAMMDDVTRDEVVRRLRSVEGHIRGVQRMVEERQYCVDVIRQIIAAQAAMAKVNDLVLKSHLNTCVIEAVRSDDLAARERVLGEIGDVFEMARRV